MGTVTWQYSDWHMQTTPALQLERLKLHLQEVEGYMLESNSKGRGLKLSDSLLPHLTEELRRLETRVATSVGVGRFGVSKYTRGDTA